jgi:outer membrane protein
MESIIKQIFPGFRQQISGLKTEEHGFRKSTFQVLDPSKMSIKNLSMNHLGPQWLKKVLLVVITTIFASNSNAADLLTSWRAACTYDANFLAAGKALAAGLEKSTQGDSMILPQVALTANIGEAKKNVQPGDTSITSTDTQGPQYGAGLSLVQPIYNVSAFAIRNELNIQAQEARVQYRVAEQDLILRVAKAYFEMLLAQKNVDLVKAQMEAVSQQLAQAKKMFSVGSATITDTNEAQARFDSIVAGEISARNDLSLKQAVYQQLTNLDPLNLVPVSETRTPVPPQPAVIGPWLTQAQSDSLTVIAQKMGIQISNSEITRYRLESSPTLALVAGFGTQWDGSTSTRSGLLDRTSNSTIGLQLTIPLYTGGYRSSKYREAVSLAAQQRDALEAAIRDAQQTTRQSFLGVETGAAQIKALEQANISSASSVASSKMGRDVGVRTTVDVLNAQQIHYQNQYNLAVARYQYLLSKLQLAASVGNLNVGELENVNGWLVTNM